MRFTRRRYKAPLVISLSGLWEVAAGTGTESKRFGRDGKVGREVEDEEQGVKAARAAAGKTKTTSLKTGIRSKQGYNWLLFVSGIGHTAARRYQAEYSDLSERRTDQPTSLRLLRRQRIRPKHKKALHHRALRNVAEEDNCQCGDTEGVSASKRKNSLLNEIILLCSDMWSREYVES